MNNFLCLDTNIFEHFAPVDQIDWLSLTKCDSATLVIPQITIRELNRHKDTASRPRLKRRAASALIQLTKWAREPQPVTIKRNIDLIFLHNEPGIDFSAYHLQRDMPDDYLIASAVEFASDRNLPPERVVVVTADLGLELKVRGCKFISQYAMPEDLRVADEPDAEEKRVIELQAELRKLSLQLPNLTLRLQEPIDDAGNNMSPVFWNTQEASEEELARLLDLEKDQHPYRAPHPSPPRGYVMGHGNQMTMQRFNDTLNRYFSIYSHFLKKRAEAQTWRARTRTLELVLENTGGVPATQIELRLEFPVGLSILSEHEYRKDPTPPTAPKWRETDISVKNNFGLEYENPDETPPITVGNIWNLETGTTIILNPARLRHLSKDEFGVIVHFEEAAAVHPFQVKYRIWMSNYPSEVTGELNVIVRPGLWRTS